MYGKVIQLCIHIHILFCIFSVVVYHRILVCLFVCFFGHAHGMWKFWGQGSNFCHSSDQSHCSDHGGEPNLTQYRRTPYCRVLSMFPVLWSRTLLFICFAYGRLYLLIPNSSFSPLSPPLPFFGAVCVCVCFLLFTAVPAACGRPQPHLWPTPQLTGL